LNKESNVGHPYAQRNRYNNPVFVPNGHAKVVHETLVTEDWETWTMTYMRSTINSEAVTNAR
jgi:hypothetical protein